jgi:hypothetical protein
MGNFQNANNLDILQAGMGNRESLFGYLFQHYQLVIYIFPMISDGMKIAKLLNAIIVHNSSPVMPEGAEDGLLIQSRTAQEVSSVFLFFALNQTAPLLDGEGESTCSLQDHFPGEKQGQVGAELG